MNKGVRGSGSEAVAQFQAVFWAAKRAMKEAADEAYGHHGVRNGQQFILMCLWDEDGLTPGEIDEEMRRLSERALGTLSPAERAELVRLLDQLHKNLAGG